MHQIDSDYNVLLKNGVPVSLFFYCLQDSWVEGIYQFSILIE